MGGVSGGTRPAGPGRWATPTRARPATAQRGGVGWLAVAGGASSLWPSTWAPSGPGRQRQDPRGPVPQVSGLRHPIVKPAQDLHWPVVALDSGPT